MKNTTHPRRPVRRRSGLHDPMDRRYRALVGDGRDRITDPCRWALVRLLRRVDLQLWLLQLGAVLRDRTRRRRRVVPAQLFQKQWRGPAWQKGPQQPVLKYGACVTDALRRCSCSTIPLLVLQRTKSGKPAGTFRLNHDGRLRASGPTLWVG